MSEDYAKQIDDLRVWFRERLPAHGQISLTKDQWKAGVDSLTGYHADLVRAAHIEWLTTRKYELSYNQTCVAFFGAADDCDLLDVEPPHQTTTSGGE